MHISTLGVRSIHYTKPMQLWLSQICMTKGELAWCAKRDQQQFYIKELLHKYLELGWDQGWFAMKLVAPGFKNKTRYTPYVSLGSHVSHIATNKGNINRQCSIYNVLGIKNITLDSKQREDNSDLRVKTPIPQGQLTG